MSTIRVSYILVLLIFTALLCVIDSEEIARRELSTFSITTQTQFSNVVASNVTIHITADIDLSSTIDIKNINSLVVHGNGHKIDGLDSFRVLNIQSSTVSVHDVVIRNGYSPSSLGGGIRSLNSTLTLSNCTLQSNNAEYGGALYSLHGKVIISETLFYDNGASYGGAVYADYSASYIDGSTLFGNVVGFDGGAAHFNFGNVSISFTVFHDNTAELGGAIYTHYTDTIVTDCVMFNNIANDKGGAISFNYAVASISDSNFSTNTAVFGGALYMYTINTTIDRCMISDNSASDDGGGVYTSHCDTVISHTKFVGNSATNDGGAVYLFWNTVSILYSAFNLNAAGNSGGAVFSFWTWFRLEFSEVDSNTAQSDGGGLYYKWFGGWLVDVEIHNCKSMTGFGGGAYVYDAVLVMTLATFDSNKAFQHGGGLYLDYSSEGEMTSCSLTGNTADFGAGMYVHYSVLTVHDSSITDNVARGNAGGAYLFYANANITGTDVVNNTAVLGAGVIIYSNSDFHSYLTGCNFTENDASTLGGGFYFYSGKADVTDCVLYKNSATRGGGMYVSGGSSTQIKLDQSNFTSNSAEWGGAGMYLSAGTVDQNHIVYRNNHASSSTFKVVSNQQKANCTAIGTCFYSSNYPSNYNNDEYCSFMAMGSGTLSIKDFQTEDINDYLEVNGVQYSDVDGPASVSVSNEDVISWTSNSAITKGGFEICFANGANGGAMFVNGGTNNVENSLFIANDAVQYGGGIFINGGTNKMTNVKMMDNVAELGGSEYYIDGGSFAGSDITITSFSESASPIAGSSSQSAECVSTCLPGQHGVCDVSSSASSCYVNCECFNCTAGTSSSVEFSTLSSDCANCDSGTYTDMEGLTSCSSCAIGKFATNNVSDFGGGLAVQVISGATLCHPCPAGYYAAFRETFVCSTCEAGKVSGTGSSNCTSCAMGTYSENGDSVCTKCASGTYSPVVGSQLCIDCDTSKSSSPGSSFCDQAVANFYLLDSVARECPSGATCEGGYSTPIPDKGYWMDRSSSSYTNYAYVCSRETCAGSSAGNSSCWTVEALDNHLCDDDIIMCKKGSEGPLCGSCSSGYSYASDKLICVPCGTDTMIQYTVLVVLIIALSFLAFLRLYKVLEIPVFVWDAYPILVMRHMFKSGSMKVLISSYQIIQSVTYSMEVEYPATFATTLSWFDFLNFELPGLECGGFGIYERVYFASLLPIFLAFLILVVGQIRIWLIRRDSSLNMTKTKKYVDHVNAQHAWGLLFLSYLVVPPVTGKQLKALDCFPFSKTDGSNLLRLDTSIDCDSKSHQLFQAIDIVMICIYLSIPIIWLVLIYRHREQLWPSNIAEDTLIIERRKVESSLLVLRFLFERYKPSMACFESFDICRRILFVGIVPLMASSVLLRSAIGLGFSLVSMIIYRELTPFMSYDTNVVAYIADIVIYLTYASALMIETGLNKGMDNFTFGLILIAVNFSILVTAITAAFFRTLIEKETTYRKKENYIQDVEDASDFSLHKFHTTFDVINRTLITHSHCSLIFYGSLMEVKHILRHGIPVSDQFTDRGIVFTLNQPHTINDQDRLVFRAFEAFVVVSLPRRLLTPFRPHTDHKSLKTDAMKESSSPLWLLPKSVIIAMRGSYFDDILDPLLWHEQVLLLPPQVIKRAYQLNRNAYSEELGFVGIKQLCDKSSKNRTKVFPLDGNTEMVSQQRLAYFEHEDFPIPLTEPIRVSKIGDYLDMMSKVRQYCRENGLVPVYHYTKVELAILIIKSGFKMATKGQGDGGIYFSTSGPASYDIGSPHYEENIIIDSFGMEKLEEQRGRHRCDICMVYAMDPLLCDVLDSGTGLHVPQEYFRDLSLSHPDGSFLLRMDRLLACFHLDPTARIGGLDEKKKEIEAERIQDMQVGELLHSNHVIKLQNEKEIGSLLNEILPCVHVQWAVTFGGTKFNNILTELENSYKLQDYKLFYHYSSLTDIEKYVRCGIPVLKKYALSVMADERGGKSPTLQSSRPGQLKSMEQAMNGNEKVGVVFTLNHPDHLSDSEIQLFGNCEAFLACYLPTRLLKPYVVMKKNPSIMERNHIQKVKSMRRGNSLSSELEIKRDDEMKSNLHYLPLEVIKAMKGDYFDKLVDPEPWRDGLLLLQPQCIKSAYQIMSEEKVSYHLQCELSSDNCVVDEPLTSAVQVVQEFTSTVHLQDSLDKIDKQCSENGLVPFYHYTDKKTAASIIHKGFKVSSQSSGVVFSTSNPLTYDLNSTSFQNNIIIDLFGERALQESAPNEVEVCVVYGVDPILVDVVREEEGATEERRASLEGKLKIVPRGLFKDLSMAHEDGCYYLRPDRALGAFGLVSSPTQRGVPPPPEAVIKD